MFDKNNLVQEKKTICVKFDTANKTFTYLNNISKNGKDNINTEILRPYKKKIILNGLGFKVEVVNNTLVFNLGYSSKKSIIIPLYISSIKIIKNVLLLESFDKTLLGNFANEICKLRTPNVYKLKGLLLEGFRISKKEVKKK